MHHREQRGKQRILASSEAAFSSPEPALTSGNPDGENKAIPSPAPGSDDRSIIPGEGGHHSD